MRVATVVIILTVVVVMRVVTEVKEEEKSLQNILHKKFIKKMTN